MSGTKPKILHVSEAFAGGVASHIEELLPLQLAEFGENSIGLLVPSDQVANIDVPTGVELFPYKRASSRILSTFQLIKAVHKVTSAFRPSVIHSHSTFAGVASRVDKILGNRVPIVYCPHGWAFAQEVPHFSKLVYSFIERIQGYATAAIVTVSEHERNLAISVGLPKYKLHCIRNGISDVVATDALTQRPEVERDESNTSGIINLLYVGRFDRQKGVDLLFEAIRQVSSDKFHFHVIGAPIRSDQVLKLPESANVTFHGWQPRSFVFEMLRTVDALLLPSRWEGLPIIALEAFRSGTPVISSDASVMPEIVIEGISGILFESGSTQSLIATLNSLKLDELRSLGSTARQLYLQEFRIERQHQALVGLYRNLMQDGRRHV